MSRGTCHTAVTKRGRQRPTVDVVLAVALVFSILGALLSACSSRGGEQLTCRSGDLDDRGGASLKVMVLIDVDDNSEGVADEIARAVAGELGDVLAASAAINLVGLVSGGNEESVRGIVCMDGATYRIPRNEDEGPDVLLARREEFVAAMREPVKRSVMATSVPETGDIRVLLQKISDTVGQDDATVILWGSFLSQGTDCLEQQPGQVPSYQLAVELASRCEDLALLPQLPTADLTVLGAGSTADDEDPARMSFGLSLAAELCNRMARTCDIREPE